MPSLSLLVLLMSPLITAYLVPPPSGKYNVTLTIGTLTDHSRNDPYAPSPTPRSLVLSVFEPAECASTISVPYMDTKTAEYQGPFLQTLFNTTFNINPLFLAAELPVCPADPDQQPCATPEADEDSPILLFSTSYLVPRTYYSYLASSLASTGMTVITIDHPFDANILVYPDGHTVYNNASIEANATWDLFPRAADASFIIDQLSNTTAMATLLPHRGPYPFATDRIVMAGHSAGGAAALIAASQDPRIRAAVNWDGAIIGSPQLPSTPQPILFLSRDGNLGVQDDTWEAAWPALAGPKVWLRVWGATHQSFSDVPTLVEASGRGMEGLRGLLGRAEVEEMVGILVEWTRGWVWGAFDGELGERVGRLEGMFEGVKVVRQGSL